MKRFVILLISFVFAISLYSQDALYIYQKKYYNDSLIQVLPLSIPIREISGINHSEVYPDIYQTSIALKKWKLNLGNYVYYNEDHILFIDSLVFVEVDTLHNVRFAYPSCPDDHHPHAIDMGLPSGTKWSCCNVGSTSPEELGNYYAWGETFTKDHYWGHLDGKISNYTLEDRDGRGLFIGAEIAGTQYDVAHVKWGESWRMPSQDHLKELCENCAWTWVSIDGVQGYLVTGPNGGTIFMPAAGYFTGNLVENMFYYWSSTYESTDMAWILSESGNEVVYNHSFWRTNGLPVRPVISNEEIPQVPNNPQAIDLGLPSGTKWANCNVGAELPEQFGNYYAWRETKEKDNYSFENYPFKHLEPYYNEETGEILGWDEVYDYYGDIAGTLYDVAHVEWGGSWRMPTLEQFKELCENCIFTWTKQNDVSGELITGPNGNTIFIPATGYKLGDEIQWARSRGNIWTSTQNMGNGSGAFVLYFYNSKVYLEEGDLSEGLPVRPVCK